MVCSNPTESNLICFILGQTDRFIPGFEKLLAILNRFQDSLLRNLQVPNQMNQSNHLISSSANGIRTESHNHDRDHICRDQIGCDSPQIGFSKPPSSSIMGGLLNDHYLMDQKPNSFRNQQGTKIIPVSIDFCPRPSRISSQNYKARPYTLKLEIP